MMLFDLVYLILAVAVLYLLVKFLSVPLSILYNGVLGAVILWVVNIFGPFFGISIEINVINSLIAGFFGVPGVLFLLLYKYF